MKGGASGSGTSVLDGSGVHVGVKRLGELRGRNPVVVAPAFGTLARTTKLDLDEGLKTKGLTTAS